MILLLLYFSDEVKELRGWVMCPRLQDVNLESIVWRGKNSLQIITIPLKALTFTKHASVDSKSCLGSSFRMVPELEAQYLMLKAKSFQPWGGIWFYKSCEVKSGEWWGWMAMTGIKNKVLLSLWVVIFLGESLRLTEEIIPREILIEKKKKNSELPTKLSVITLSQWKFNPNIPFYF